MTPPPVEIGEEDVPALAARYAAGATLEQLSADTGAAMITIARKLRQFGVALRPPGRPPGRVPGSRRDRQEKR